MEEALNVRINLPPGGRLPGKEAELRNRNIMALFHLSKGYQNFNPGAIVSTFPDETV